MKECWINVYDQSIYPLRLNLGMPCESKEQARLVSVNCYIVAEIKTLYRIHVRMK